MSTPATCPDCGAPLGPAARGLCPRCLAEMAVESNRLETDGDAETASKKADEAFAGAEPRDEYAAPCLGDRPGTLIGRYKLLEKIGEGGFGVVYLAEQLEPVQREVALKVIKPGMDTREVIARFEAERQALALMDHPNIAKVLDGGATEQGHPYFVMELVRGVPITEFCDQKALSTTDRLQLFIQVCHAVQHAHQKAIIHRDLKPSNILVTLSDGKPVPKVIDFGVAKALGQKLTEKTLFTAFQRMIGTPAYMSPEQAEVSGLDVDTRSDIYSLGVLLYELLTGVTPFDAESLGRAALDEVRRLIRETEPPKPSTRLQTLGGMLPEVAKRRHTDAIALSRMVRGDLDWIVMKCLEKDRIRRYDTANALALDLKHHLLHEPVTAAAPSPGYRLAKFTRRHRAALVTGAAFLLLLVAGTVTSVWQALQARRSAADATRLAAEESRQRRLASASAEQSRERLVRLNLANGNRLLDEGDYFGAMPWFSEALRLHQGVADKEPIDHLRLSMLLEQSPRLLQMWFHGQAVNTAEFSPDGKQVMTASEDQTARVWDVDTGEALIPALRHAGPLTCAHFSPDGRRSVVTAGRDNARLWNAVDGRLEITLEHEQVEDAKFSPDGRVVATASYDGTIKVWEVSRSPCVVKVLRHRGGPRTSQSHAGVAFSSDGKLLLSAGYDTAARVWDVESGALLQDLQGLADVRYAQFSPDGAQVALANWGNSAMLWDARSGVLLLAALPHQGMVDHVSFSPKGDLLVSSSIDGTAKMWETGTGKLVRTFGNGKDFVMAATFSPNGRHLLLRAFTGQVQAWSIQTGQAVSPPLLHGAQVTYADIHPDGRRIVTACADGTVRLWDMQPQGSSSSRLRLPHDLEVLSVSPTGALIATADPSGRLQVWETSSWSSNTLGSTSKGNILQALFTSDERRFLTIELVSGQVRRGGPALLDFKGWDVTGGRLLYRATAPATSCIPEAITFAASPDCRQVAFSSGCVVEAWDLVHTNLMWRSGPYVTNASVIDYSPDATRVLVKSGRLVHLLEGPSGTQIGSALTNRLPIRAVQFSPDGQLVAASCSDESYEDGEVRIWEAATGRLRRVWEHKDGVPGLAFSPDGSRLATGGEPGFARVFDVRTGQPITPYVHHGNYVNAVALSHDNRLLATACLGHPPTVRVWDGLTGEAITPPLALPFQYIRRVDQLTFLPGGRYLAGQNRRATRLWSLEASQRPIEDLLTLARLVSGRAIDATGVMEPAESSVLRDLWRRLQGRIPEAFAFLPLQQTTSWDLAVHCPRRIISVPARDPKARPNLIDLGSFYNATLEDFMESVDNVFSSLPRGVHAFGGVEFEVRGLLHLAGKETVRLFGNRYPVSIEGIPVNRRCQALHSLLGTQWGEGDGIRIALFLVHYADGEELELPIIFGEDVRNWPVLASDAPTEEQLPARGTLAWTGENPKVKRLGGVLPLYKRTWKNPRPEAEIKSVDFISTMTRCAPLLVAITVE